MTQASARFNRARATGLQAAQAGLAAQLRGYKDTLGHEDYAELLLLHGGTLEREKHAVGLRPAKVRRLRRAARLAEAA